VIGPEGRWISVTSSGEASVAPDLAVVSAGISGKAKELGPARDDVNQRASAVLAAARDLGVADADLEAAAVAIHPEYDYRSGGQRLVGYLVSRSVSVTVRDLGALGPLIDAVVAAGANEMHGVHMSSTDPSAAEHEALRRAVAAARAKAEAIAAAAGITLGGTVRIEEEPDHPVAPIGRMRMAAMAEAADVPTEVATADLTVTRRVRATFAIG
jgi:uncharacterized protein